MKTQLSILIVFFCLCSISIDLSGQGNVAINNSGASPDASAILDVQSSTKGLLVPRMSTADRTGITSPATGLIVYDLDVNSFFFYAGSDWIEVIGGFTSLLSDNDEDTKIEVESTTDEDTIKFTVAGTQVAKMDARTFHFESPGKSVFIGKNAGINDDGTNNTNTFIGLNAGKSNTTGSSNIFLGTDAGVFNENGSSNIFMGPYSGLSNTSGEQNVFIGHYSGASNVDGTRNIFIGPFSGYYSTSGEHNLAIGDEAFFSNETGSHNIALGKGAMIANINGEENLAIGSWTLSQSTASTKNIAIGYYSLTNNTYGEENTAVGHEAMYFNQIGNYNSAFGRRALYQNDEGYSNVAFGVESLLNNTSGNSNAAYGVSSLANNSLGNQNSALGTGALFENTSGHDNVGIGYVANQRNQTGSQNTIVGSQAGGISTPHTKSGNVFLGYKAGFSETGDNKLYIENSSSTAPLIYGDFSNGSELVAINGDLGVGTQSPAHPLHVLKNGTDSVQTIVGILQSNTSGRPVLLFSENSTNGLSSGMSIEYNGAAGTGGNNEMYVNHVGGEPMVTFENSGKVGLGTTHPDTRMHIEGGTDTGLGGGGFITLGALDATNISIDDNEIMARNNGGIANMYMQANGGKLGIGAVTFDSKLNVRSDEGEDPFRARVGSATKFLVHSNGGVAVGANATPPANGLKVFGDILMEGDDITSNQTLRLNSSTRIELVVGTNTIIIDPVDGISITSDGDMTFTAGNNIMLDAGGDIILEPDDNLLLNVGFDFNVDVAHDILIDGDKDIDILANGYILLDALQMIDMTAGTELEINADNLDFNSDSTIEIDGVSTVDIDGSQVRLNTEGNSSANAAYSGSNVSVPPCSVGCNGTVNTGSSAVKIGY